MSAKIMIAGGGTGGHLFPGIAVAEVLRDKGYQVIFVSRGNELEKRALTNAGFKLESILIEGVKGRGLKNKLIALCKIPVATLQSLWLMAKYRPKVVVGLGSYSAGPVVLAGWLTLRKIALMEQNATPGVTNKLCSRFAKKIFVSFWQVTKFFNKKKCVLTGNPVRMSFFKPFEITVPKAQDMFTILVLGGSQGAAAVNRLVAETLPYLENPKDILFIHQSGPADVDMLRAAYASAGVEAVVEAFFVDMPGLYFVSDFVICRGGATTIAELTAMGKAAFFIPFPFAADNHQEKNAFVLVNAGAALMGRENKLDGASIARALNDIRNDRSRLVNMEENALALGKPNAALDVAMGIIGL